VVVNYLCLYMYMYSYKHGSELPILFGYSYMYVLYTHLFMSIRHSYVYQYCMCIELSHMSKASIRYSTCHCSYHIVGKFSYIAILWQIAICGWPTLKLVLIWTKIIQLSSESSCTKIFRADQPSTKYHENFWLFGKLSFLF